VILTANFRELPSNLKELWHIHKRYCKIIATVLIAFFLSAMLRFLVHLLKVYLCVMRQKIVLA